LLSKEDERWASLTATLVVVLNKFNDQGTHLDALSDDFNTLKPDQGCLHAAINNVQSKKLHLATSAPGATHGQKHVDPPMDTSATGGKVGAILNAATHKLWFPKYDGSDDSLPWPHCCE
jgi:hypothetical protein